MSGNEIFVSAVVAILTTLATNFIAAYLKKAKIKVSVLGVQKVNDIPKRLKVSVCIRNDGDNIDTLEAAHFFLSKSDQDYSNYSMDIDEAGVWSFAKPVFCAAESITMPVLDFWITWDNIPQRLELSFVCSGTIVIDIHNNHKVKALFEGDSASTALAYAKEITKDAQAKLLPQWFE